MSRMQRRAPLPVGKLALPIVVILLLMGGYLAWSLSRKPVQENQPVPVGAVQPTTMRLTTTDSAGLIGGPGGSGPMAEQVPGRLLVGFEITIGRLSGHRVIKSLQGIYREGDGPRVRGKQFGEPGEGAISVEAKDGYAVGALTVKAAERVNGLQITFMKRLWSVERGFWLDRTDEYQSEWIGGRGGEGPVRLGGDGRAIIGLKARWGKDLDALGVVHP